MNMLFVVTPDGTYVEAEGCVVVMADPDIRGWDDMTDSDRYSDAARLSVVHFTEVGLNFGSLESY